MTGVRWTGHDTVRVAWSEDWRSQDGGRVDLTLAEGSNDRYGWSWDWESAPDDPRLHEEYSDPNVTPIVRAGGVQVGVEITGLRPGGDYRIAVQGPYRWVAVGEPWIQALPSDVFLLKPRGRVSGSPAAASQIGARVTGPDSIRLHWRDNSGVETGYEVWYRKWSGEEPDEVWSRFGEPLPARTRYVDVEGMAVEEEIRVTDGYYDSKKRVWVEGQKAKIGRYSFAVVAYNDKGWNASETFDLEFMPEPYPAPTVLGETTDCVVWLRSTGIDLDGYQVDACLETPDGARRRAWDYQLEADQSGLLYFFDRDNAEVLIKVLDGCGVNGHRWVFVAPLAFFTLASAFATTADDARSQVEDAHEAAEKARRGAENALAAAEFAASETDKARDAAEEAGAAVEKARAGAEEARGLSDDARALTEDARDAAEEARDRARVAANAAAEAEKDAHDAADDAGDRGE